MKITPTFLLSALFLATLFIVGCVGDKAANPTPAPLGNFSGQFRLLHRARGASKIDTTKATLQLSLAIDGTFTVFGDTAVVHAGSKGKYAVSDAYLGFQDVTYPVTGRPAKAHLNGYYSFYYDGTSVLQMVANSSDTLAVQYDLKKVN